MPGPKAQRKWPCTSIGLSRSSLGGQGTSVLSVANFAVNVATACYPAFTRSYCASVRPAEYGFPRRPRLGNSVNRGKQPPGSVDASSLLTKRLQIS